MLNDVHTLQCMAIMEADIFALSCVCFRVSGAARDGSAYSGNHRMDSAGHLPHEARTTQ